MAGPIKAARRLLRRWLKTPAAAKRPHAAKRARKAVKVLAPAKNDAGAPKPPAKPGHKLRIPGALWKPIPQTSTDPTIIPVGPIFHVAVSEASSLHDFFERDGGIESTGYIRRDGTIEQYRPLNVECDAQFDGNSWIGADGRRYGFTSWETQGMGSGQWTAQQVAAIQKIITFHHDQWETPYRVAPAWNEAGVGYHCLFDRWNKSHHTCPGPDRVKQFNRVIVPWLKAAK